jgi:hypothetical protein
MTAEFFLFVQEKRNNPMPSRISYKNWIGATGQVPDFQHDDCEFEKNSGRAGRIGRWVARALDKLTPLEREVVIRYFLSGQSLSDIAGQLGKDFIKTKNTYRRAVLRLRKNLAPYVRREFVLNESETPRCCLCLSPYRAEIDALIRSKRREETWRRIIKILKSDFGLKAIAPQRLIGHRKYHMEDY